MPRIRQVVRLFVLSLLTVFFASCKPTPLPLATSEQPQYLRLTDTLGIQKAEVYDPFNHSEVLARYYLVTDSAQTTPTDGVRLQVPLRRIATTSATHIGFLQALGRTDRIVAMATPHLVYNLPTQPITDIGEDINLRIEPLLLSHPDALFISAYGQNMQSLGHVTEAGVPVVYFTEWREASPLARMAWVRFMGLLMGETDRADSLIAAVSEAYHQEVSKPLLFPIAVPSCRVPHFAAHGMSPAVTPIWGNYSEMQAPTMSMQTTRVTVLFRSPWSRHCRCSAMRMCG